MLFNSFQFLIFFVVVTTAYFALPHKFRWMLLLAASCYFYMAFIPIYILILGFTIVIDYFAGIFLEKIEGRNKKIFLIASLVSNIGVLAIFKYYNFLNSILGDFLSFVHVSNPVPLLHIILPIGLSFHTFQAMSYTIEVYRGNQKAEKHFGIYALYVMFYPQLVAGPIERPQNLLHQFRTIHTFDYDRVIHGMNFITIGLFKKMVIADRLLVYVNQVFGNVDNFTTIPIILSVIFFSFQIYCDFSGYSDIAIGAAKIMGIDLMTNFNRPYLSKSISEFWKRWHISLSSWFRDYLYIPLGGNRVVKWRWYYNLFFTFFISGLWHGANWTFLIWGSLHGIYLISAIFLEKPKSIFKSWIGLNKWILLDKFQNVFVTFILVAFSWIFFRAANVSQAFLVIHKIAELHLQCNLAMLCAYQGPFNLILSFLAIALLFLSYLLPRNMKLKYPLLFIIVVTLIILVLGKGENNEFIYFQF